MMLLPSQIPKTFLTEPPFNAVYTPPQQWRLTSKKQRGAAIRGTKKIWVGRANFKKVDFFTKKALLKDAKFSVLKNKDQTYINIKVFTFRSRCFIYLGRKYLI